MDNILDKTTKSYSYELDVSLDIRIDRIINNRIKNSDIANRNISINIFDNYNIWLIRHRSHVNATPRNIPNKLLKKLSKAALKQLQS